MPAQSEKQAIAARIARGIQKGEVKPKAGTASAEMAKMNPSSLKHFTKMEEANKPVINPDALKKVVQYLAKEAEDFQNYVGIDASYDVEFSTIDDIIKDSRNQKLQKFWRSLSDKQQMGVYEMIHQYLLNKEIKKDPEYFGDQKPQPINYVLAAKTKPSGPAPKGDALNKLVDKLARDAESWMNYLDVDSPEQIQFHDFVDYVIEDPETNPRIKNYWNSLRGSQQEALFKKIVAVLEKTGGFEDEEMYENINLSAMAKKLREDWRDDPKLSRDWEKSDVSQYEFERSRGFGKHRRGGSEMLGITFYNVPAGKEEVARSKGLTQFKSGKWGYKHYTQARENDPIMQGIEKEFGKGRYWEPKN